MINLLNVNKSIFIEEVQEKRVVCFGAGKKFYDICQEYPQMVDRIICVADNNVTETHVKINNNIIPIVSFEDSILDAKGYVGVISSSIYADEIIKKLDKIDKFDSMITYVPFMFDMEYQDEIVIKKKVQKIPKIIHYCWFGNTSMPDDFERNIETWRKRCSDYEIICWNEENYDYKKNEYMYEAYKAKKWGFVPDYARLDIINQYGGIYLDTDVEVLKTYDELLGLDMFCGFESEKYVALGLGFGSHKDNPILLEMMNQYCDIKFLNSDGTYNLTASPIYQTQILKKHGLNCDGSFQIVDGCAVFPQEYFAPSDGSLYRSRNVDRAFSIHQYAATWQNEEEQIRKRRMIESSKYVKQRFKANGLRGK